ncbi:1,6-anhydro-N-acetylmuramyl-L-alanine amidase AmpD [Vibrio salinus]|uniref:1,6-anhydro-N-acetylmuramyl-L-alanine amidase AmpD n=1 Tax=Vibrio salinus TaxID=2899784 RepID=UPI001E2966EC|nr:1,6-anhydro-N-acetylmuramyl-L-alanine amidase AmpD [Vibrio salinus]MCE0493373.1 1,6-anhydro-N-acetylmuramyl-L-alanine amidase AmpD [Vibrio salinus]
MKISSDGWFPGARRVPSSFYDKRPETDDISLLVIHNISLPPGRFGGPYVEQLFTGKLDSASHPFFVQIASLRVSAHCFIRRDGEIVQFVSFDNRAWHAGVSSFSGKQKCNDFSIGIELEGTDMVTYTEEQYQSLAELTKAIQEKYPAIKKNRITGHQFIAPLRKSDPGLSFDWSRYRKSLTDK